MCWGNLAPACLNGLAQHISLVTFQLLVLHVLSLSINIGYEYLSSYSAAQCPLSNGTY